MESNITEFDLTVRYQIYRFFAERGAAPSVEQIAQLLNTQDDVVRTAFRSLHTGHMIFLEPNRDAVRMANPFSAIPTDFKVKSGQKEWWANCAWDSLGIAAALDIDVHIEAKYPDSPETVHLSVQGGDVKGGDGVVYFPLPCRQWYNDLIFT